MKFIKTCCLLFFLLVLGGEKSEGQTWLWAEAAVNDTIRSFTDPFDLIVDKSGNVFESGLFQGKVNFGSVNLKAVGNADPFLVKFDNTGNPLWGITTVDSTNPEGAWVALDDSGNVYITGSYGGNMSLSSFHFPYSSADNLFISKFNTNGTLKWCAYSTSSKKGYIFTSSITIDKSDNVLVTGEYSDSVSLGPFHFYAPPSEPVFFLAKYDKNGNIIWAESAKSASYTSGNTIVVDTSENVYVTGTFRDSLTIGSSTIKSIGGGDVFLAKYTPLGNLTWIKSGVLPSAKSICGSGYGGRILSIDNVGNLYLTGSFNDTVQFGTSTLIAQPKSAIFIVKYSNSGNVIWAKKFDSRGIPFFIIHDTIGNFYLSGNYSDSISFNFIKLKSDSNSPAFLVKFDSSWNVLCASSIENDNDDWSCVGIDPLSNNIFFSGDIAPNYGIGDANCYFGSYWLKGDNEFAFLAKWACSACKMNDTITTGKTTLCSGDSTTLKGFGGLSYIWSTGSSSDSITVEPIVTTTYTLYATNGTCFGDTTITINVNSFPLPSFTYNSKICLGVSDTIEASGGAKYKWSNGDTLPTIIVNPTSNISYTVSISNGLCSVKDSVSIQVTPYPVPQITGKQYLCPNQSATISASGGSTYLWNTGDTISSITVTPVSTAFYIVSISNGNCAITDSTAVIVNPFPNVTICCDSLIVRGGSVQLISSGGQSFQWSPSTGLSCDTCRNPVAMPNSSTTYTLTVISDSGCVTTRLVTIDVTCGDVFIPNAFSPGEANNSKLFVRGPCISTMDFMVFDRWGNKMFESQNPEYGWDGTFKGLPMTTGTYVWYVKATMLDGTTVERKGNVALVR